MKKLILSIFALVFFGFQSHAQVSQGRVFIGGEFNVASSSTDLGASSSVKTTSFSLVPNVGFMLSDKFALGLGVGYRSSSVETPITTGTTGGKSEVTEGTFVVAPFARYYVPTAGDRFYFFAQAKADLGFGNSSTKTTIGTTTTTTNDGSLSTIGVFVSPNFAWFPSDHWSIEFGVRGIGYSLRDPNGDNNNTSTFEFNLDSLAPKLGIQFYF